jgi:hypothetical protein
VDLPTRNFSVSTRSASSGIAGGSGGGDLLARAGHDDIGGTDVDLGELDQVLQGLDRLGPGDRGARMTALAARLPAGSSNSSPASTS